jgi:hypothetical protein
MVNGLVLNWLVVTWLVVNWLRPVVTPDVVVGVAIDPVVNSSCSGELVVPVAPSVELVDVVPVVAVVELVVDVPVVVVVGGV